MKTNPAMEKIGLKPNHQLMNPEFEGKHKEYIRKELATENVLAII